MCDHCGCRQFPSIAELSEEHEQILAVAWELSEDRRSPGREDTEACERLLRMLAVHVRTEEEALYPLLVGTGAAMFGFEDEDWDVLDATERFVSRAVTAS